MPFAATWMKLEIIILSEVSQKEKDKYHMNFSIETDSETQRTNLVCGCQGGGD